MRMATGATTPSQPNPPIDHHHERNDPGEDEPDAPDGRRPGRAGIDPVGELQRLRLASAARCPPDPQRGR